jgi:hypothetical protein
MALAALGCLATWYAFGYPAPQRPTQLLQTQAPVASGTPPGFQTPVVSTAPVTPDVPAGSGEVRGNQVPEPDAAELAKQKAYPLTLVGIRSQAAGHLRTKCVLTVQIDDAAGDPALLGVSDFRLKNAITDPHKVPVVQSMSSGFSPFSFSETDQEGHELTGPGRKHRANLNLEYEAPQEVTRLLYVELEGNLVWGRQRVQAVWDDPARQLLEKKTVADCTFTLSAFNIDDTSVIINLDCDCTTQPIGRYLSFSPVVPLLYYTDGTKATGVLCNRGGSKHKRCLFPNPGKKTPLKLELSFVPQTALEQTPQRLVLRDIVLPERCQALDDSAEPCTDKSTVPGAKQLTPAEVF